MTCSQLLASYTRKGIQNFHSEPLFLVTQLSAKARLKSQLLQIQVLPVGCNQQKPVGFYLKSRWLYKKSPAGFTHQFPTKTPVSRQLLSVLFYRIGRCEATGRQVWLLFLGSLPELSLIRNQAESLTKIQPKQVFRWRHAEPGFSSLVAGLSRYKDVGVFVLCCQPGRIIPKDNSPCFHVYLFSKDVCYFLLPARNAAIRQKTLLNCFPLFTTDVFFFRFAPALVNLLAQFYRTFSLKKGLSSRTVSIISRTVRGVATGLKSGISLQKHSNAG